MPSFLVDEDLPLSLACAMRDAGWSTSHVREVGLRGAPDAQVIARAKEHGEVLVTADLEFANIVAYPPGSHAGIVVVRLSTEIPVRDRVATVVQAIGSLGDLRLDGNLLIIERHRVRFRSGT